MKCDAYAGLARCNNEATEHNNVCWNHINYYEDWFKNKNLYEYNRFYGNKYQREYEYAILVKKIPIPLNWHKEDADIYFLIDFFLLLCRRWDFNPLNDYEFYSLAIVRYFVENKEYYGPPYMSLDSIIPLLNNPHILPSKIINDAIIILKNSDDNRDLLVLNEIVSFIESMRGDELLDIELMKSDNEGLNKIINEAIWRVQKQKCIDKTEIIKNELLLIVAKKEYAEECKNNTK
jgi:hypothetical protein